MIAKLYTPGFVVLIFAACTINSNDYDIKGLEINPSLAVPLAFGELSIQDILRKQDSQYVKVYSDGLVYLDYNKTLKSQNISNLLNIPDLAVTQSVDVPAGIIPPATADVNSTKISKTVTFGVAPSALNEISFKSGRLAYNLTLSPANPNFNYAIQLSIPEFFAKANNAPLNQEISGSGNLQLSNYIFKSSASNTFTLQLTLIIKKKTQAVTILPGTKINANFSFTGINFNYILGFFGDRVANPASDLLDIGAFGTSLANGASVSFAQPKIDFSVSNDYGVPLTINFTSLEARKPGNKLDVITSPVNPITINAPAILGGSVRTTISVTNAKALLKFAPTQFYYSVTGHINQGLSSGNNFMADTSKIRINFHVEVPLYGQASNIKLYDTLALDLKSVDKSQIESALLKTKVSNELPLDASIQFFLTDAAYVVIDSLLTPSQSGLIKGSSISANGDLKSAGVSDQLIPLDKTKLDKIFLAKKLIIRVRLNTSKDAAGNSIDVKFKSQYKLNVKLGLQATLKLKQSF